MKRLRTSSGLQHSSLHAGDEMSESSDTETIPLAIRRKMAGGQAKTHGSLPALKEKRQNEHSNSSGDRNDDAAQDSGAKLTSTQRASLPPYVSTPFEGSTFTREQRAYSQMPQLGRSSLRPRSSLPREASQSPVLGGSQDTVRSTSPHPQLLNP